MSSGLLNLLLLIWLGAASAIVRMPNAISTNMVLQRAPLAPRLWGFAAASERVSVEMDGKMWSATADAQGNWMLDLDVQQASVGRVITITGSGGGPPVVLSNIAFGDVYLCSGQSKCNYGLAAAYSPTVHRQHGVQHQYGL